MNILNQSKLIINKLSEFAPKLVIADTGSCYIHLNNCKVKCIRVANHTGHKEKPKTWQLRCDVSSPRSSTNRIYNNVNRLIADLK